MSENFIQRYCFDADDMNSIYSNLMRAYDNGITLRESIGSEDFIPVRAADAGFFESFVKAGDEIKKGQVLARIHDPYLGTVRSTLCAPVHGTVAFVHDEAMTYEHTAVLKLIREER